MGSSLFAEVRRAGRAEGEAIGRAKGELATVRSLCADLAKQHHPAVSAGLVLAIEACRDVGLLRQWALAAPRVSDNEFVRLLRRQAQTASLPRKKASPARTRRVRAAIPSRRAKASRRR